MSTLDALAVARTALFGSDLVHMERLVSSWRHLADLSFADLLLLAPITGEEGHRFVPALILQRLQSLGVAVGQPPLCLQIACA